MLNPFGVTSRASKTEWKWVVLPLFEVRVRC